jgi:hypothetical protein
LWKDLRQARRAHGWCVAAAVPNLGLDEPRSCRIEQRTELELVVNLKTAKPLGITIP